MARHNSYGWYYGFPVFNMSHRFTYFNSLANTENNSPNVAKAKQNLYSAASNAVGQASSFLSSTMDTSEMESAINFIKQAAESERQKELSILIQYKDELASKLPKNKQIDQILNKLTTIELDNPKNLQNFYSELTKCINLVRQDADKYLKELQSLANKTHNTFQDLTKDDYRFRAYGDIQSMLNNLTGMATQQQKRNEESYAANLRQVVSDYIVENKIASMLASGEDFAAIVAAITLDIERLFQEELDKDATKQDFANFTLDEMRKIIKKYTQRDISEQSRLQKAINGNYTDLQEIISATKSILGIKSITKPENIIKRNRSVGQRLSKHDETSSIMKRLQSNKELDGMVKELKLVEFNTKTNQSHGNLFELIEVLLDNAIKVNGTPATDVLVGSITFDLDTASSYNQIKKYMQQIANEFTNYSDGQRKDRMQDRTEEFEAMNEAIQYTEHELDNLIKQLNLPIPDLFIYHESLKLYAGMETGKSHNFHGREMAILSMLDELYSLGGLGGLILPQRDAITFLALNLSSAAVAGNVKGPLEKYLSLFAGLLMFDDIKNIALEASGTLSYENVKNIHLYNLNGIYVPASMILSYTAQACQDAFSEMASGYAAQATISTSGASAAINKWNDTAGDWNPTTNPFEAQWPIIGEQVANGTKVRIAFLASFIQLINDLLTI